MTRIMREGKGREKSTNEQNRVMGHIDASNPIFPFHIFASMNDVESYGIIGKEKKQTMLYQRVIAYLAILLVLLAFIFSCVGLNMGRQVAKRVLNDG